MTLADSRPAAASLSPIKTLWLILGITFVMEAVVMFVLPLFLPTDSDVRIEAIADATLLTLLTAPLVWLVIIGPLQRRVRAEISRASAILESAAEGILTTDTHGFITSFNRAAESIFTAKKDEMVTRPVANLLTQESWSAYRKLLDMNLDPPGQSIELTGVRADGRRILISVSVSRIQSGYDKTIIVVVRDLTSTKQSEQELHRRARCQEMIAELGRIALAEHTDRLYRKLVGGVREAIQADYCGLLQLSPGDDLLVLRAAADRTRDHMLQVTIDIADCRNKGFDPLSPEMTYLGSATDSAERCRFHPPGMIGETEEAGGVSVPVRGFGGGRFGVLIVFNGEARSFTDSELDFLKAASNVVTMAIERERNEIRQREHATLKADQAMAVSQIATGVAHELRNPLASVKMLVQGSLETEDALDEDDLRLIVGATRRMETTLSTFLDYARPETPHKRPVDLRHVTDGIIPLLKPRAIKQSMLLSAETLDQPVMVNADPQQLRQVLMNLVLNAFDVMPDGGSLTIKIAQTSEHASIRVSDTGPRIRDDVWLRMFEPFYTTKQSGVGLGLVVSQRIAEDHDGTLTAERGERYGTRFILELPLMRSRSKAADTTVSTVNDPGDSPPPGNDQVT